MANGEWLSPLIPGARRFYLSRATNRVGAKSASTVNCYGRPTSVLTPILPGLERGHSMPVNVNEIIRKLSPAERKKVEDRAGELIAEEMSLRDLRKARKLTQTRVANPLEDGKAGRPAELESRKGTRKRPHRSSRKSSGTVRALLTPAPVIPNPRAFGGVRDLLIAFLLTTPY